jgi:cell division protein FtsN
MIAPIRDQERRQNPRVTVAPLAYINLEPENGGIILNVSEGGLCFHSSAPLPSKKTIHFWFSVRYHRIEGDGELAWTDETQKKGGLRFTTLSPDAREQIRSWMSQLALPLPVQENIVRSRPLPRGIRAFNANEPDSRVARDRPAPRETAAPVTKRSRIVSGFSGGLATGLLVSILVAAGFLLHSYHRQVGESLIHLGERVQGRSERPVAPSPAQVAPAQPQIVSPGAIAASRPPKHVLEPSTSIVQAEPKGSEVRRQAASAPVPSSHPAGASSPIPPPPSLPTLELGRKAPLPPDIYGTVTQIEIAKPPKVRVEDSGGVTPSSISQMYFEVGTFKEKLRADRSSDELAQLGFPATVAQKGHVWRNSYHVLVGPYVHDEEAEAAHKNLLSHGFKARAFERGSENFVLRPGLTLNQTEMAAGDYIISWESYVTDAKVKFVQHGSVVATVDGKWVKSEIKYNNGAVVYRVNADGSRTLLQIHFPGMNRALVFSKSR